MTTWLSTFQLGILGGEIDITAQVQRLSWEARNVESTMRNLNGDLKATKFKNNVVVTLSAMRIPASVAAALMGFNNTLEILNFIAHAGLKITSQQETASAVNAVTLTNTALSGISIDGVFLRSDVRQSGTNYYTSGSYNSTTRVITPGSVLPSATEVVWVNYTFTGARVKISKLSIEPMQGAMKDYWAGSIELTGA